MVRTALRSTRRPLLRPALLLLGTLALTAGARAQEAPPPAFTAEDVLDVERAVMYDLSTDGRTAVVAVASLRDRLGRDNYRYGDPTYVAPFDAAVSLVDTRSGETVELRADGGVREAVFSPDGTRIALVTHGADGWGVEVVRVDDGAITPWRSASPPGGRAVSGDGTPAWSPDGGTLYLPTRAPGWADEARAEFERLTRGPVVVQSSEEDFLAWEALRRRELRRALHAWDVGDDAWRAVIPDTLLADWTVLPDGRIRWEEDVTGETSYERIFGTDETARLLDPATGEERVLIDDVREVRPTWSRPGDRWAFVRDGAVFVASVDGDEPARLTPVEPEGEAGDGDWSVLSVGPEGRRVLAARQDDWYLLERDAEPRLVLDRPDSDEEPRRDSWRVEAWTPDGGAVYLTRESRTEWRRAVARLDVGDGAVEELLVTDRLLDDVTLSRDGSTVVWASAPGNRPLDLWAAGPELDDPRRLVDANAGLDPDALADTELFSYLDADGRELYGIVYYPPDYDPARPYPTVFNVYEDFFDDSFRPTINVLTSHGYVVVRPSVHLERGYPGEAWLKGVTAAANELIRRGVADPDRLGVHGTSYGGYAVNLLVAQTDRFAAAINISGKVDMISFYTDSPRLGVRNIHAPERSQDRIGATLWEQPQKYVAHSAVMFADRIETPLLLITGRQDHNVPERTTMEMFYALRRLDRPVEWVSYVHGGHGMPTTEAAMVTDYHDRIVAWYDRWLKGDGMEGDGGG